MNQNQEKIKFSPLLFLASLGAGGLSVAFFAILHYTIEHGPGLVKMADIHGGDFSLLMKSMYFIFEGGMIFFASLHIILSIIFFKIFFSWLKTEEYKTILNNPLMNASLVAPFISIAMTMNVMLAVVRYFIPALSSNLQAMMLPGLIAWSLIWFFLMRTEIKLLGISFKNGFDVNNIHFGWLLHPFALAMVSVTGAGIAAMAVNPLIAHTAFLMLLISASMGLFLLLIKLFALFTSHFRKEGLPDKQFLPSLLIVIPNITLFSITAFRVGHYLERQFDAHLSIYFMLVVVIPFAFQLWYMAFGLYLLKEYFNDNFRKEFHVSQWGLVCPFVAMAVLSSFVYMLFIPHAILFWLISGLLFFTAFLILGLLRRQLRCFGIIKNREDFHCN